MKRLFIRWLSCVSKLLNLQCSLKYNLLVLTALIMVPVARGIDFFPASGEPIGQGWLSGVNGEASGELLEDQGAPAWYVDGRAGRAEWLITPEGNFNAEALRRGWRMDFTLRVGSGNYISNYYGNGNRRFLPILRLQGNDLIADLQGGGTYTLASGDRAREYHNYSIVFNPYTQQADFTFDGEVIESGWRGHLHGNNIVAWGNGSTLISGEAFYRSVEFDIPGYDFQPTLRLFDGNNEKGGLGSRYYRIPALQAGHDDTVVAFAEGRPNASDPGGPGQINMSAKFSDDGGRSWSVVDRISAGHPGADDSDYSDPRAIYDAITEQLWVIYTQWPSRCAQHQGCVDPDRENRLISQSFDSSSKTWNLPVNIDDSLRERAWDARGWEGLASWVARLSEQQYCQAEMEGWSLITRRKVVQGGRITDYYANGNVGRRFLPLVSLNNNNDLVVEFEGLDGSHILIENTGPSDFFTTELRYDPETGTASYFFNDRLIVSDWEGSSSDQDGVYFGNTSTDVDGRASYQSVVYRIGEEIVASYDASVRPMADATPEAQGWNSILSGRGIGALGWKSINAGPGNGIQLQWQSADRGGHNGRLIFPGIILDAFGKLHVASIYSDDNGNSWHTGALIQLPHYFKGISLQMAGLTESSIAELVDGRLLLTSRNDGAQVYNDVEYGSRMQFISENGGITWTYLQDDELQLDINRVDASLIRYSGSPSFREDSLLLFSAPIGSTPGAADRYNLGVWNSRDEGLTWEGPVQVVDGESKYSSMTVLPSGKVGILVETGPGTISLIRRELSELLPETE